MSRSGSEQDSASQHSQQQPPPGMMPPDPGNNPYAPHHPYNPNLMPHYGQAPPGMYDPRYGPPYPGAPGGGYNPIKTEPSCHPQQQMPPMNMPYGGMQPQYNPAAGYPPTMQQQQHNPTGYPGMVDPNLQHPGMTGPPHPHGSMYPGAGGYNGPGMPYPGYVKPEDFKKSQENNAAAGEAVVKTEVKDESKKEPEEPAKAGTEDKKDGGMKPTPFSVDAPADLELRPRHFSLHILNDSHKTMAARARVIREWQKVGGVLLIGYELYRQLSLKKPTKAKRKRGQPFKDPSMDVEEDSKNKPLLDEMQVALVDPGPDLVICDEGHRIKNSHASISLALKQMRTKRRIVLTGYPLQNNLLEYWCMVDFVRPNYLGKKNEIVHLYIKNT